MSAEPRPVAMSLDQLARRLGVPPASVIEKVFSRWSDVVGPAIAANARPLSLADGTLVVGAEDPAWASQLRYLASDLLARIEQVAGPGVVGCVEVRVRPRQHPS